MPNKESVQDRFWRRVVAFPSFLVQLVYSIKLPLTPSFNRETLSQGFCFHRLYFPEGPPSISQGEEGLLFTEINGTLVVVGFLDQIVSTVLNCWLGIKRYFQIIEQDRELN